ncbi:hypothetical protein Sru01_57630 [Sphaerisporangium rufum]|uniref:Uncharacterized protein n=1 Tax=Sphaerisporangium rufum TaxID=1381558 RepID=A0A919R6V9_9ACTN|nr:hypothetical protein [Sphaerisporangium rufum]GII80781.1 hypothetical protein Sru01_57630 [Sphaerisporangium rufum]
MGEHGTETREGVLPAGEAARRVRLDRELLLAEISGREAAELAAPYQVEAGPLGDFCESLHDLVAHVLMWDEINLSVLTEARLGRGHWSLAARWETPEAGRLLNRSGVLAGRELPLELLSHRFTTVRHALLAELTGYGEEWHARPAVDHERATSLGALAQYAMSVPGAVPYWHAAIHLGRSAEMAAVPAVPDGR